MKCLRVVSVAIISLSALALGACASSATSIGDKSAALAPSSLERDQDNNYTPHDKWLASGGMEGKIRPAAEQPPQPVPIQPPPPKTPISDLMVRVADIGGDEAITPVDFRSPAGARFVRVEF